MKICSKCRMQKLLKCFSPNKNSKDGLQTQCNECRAEYTRSWRLANPEKSRLAAKNWKANNLEKNKVLSKSWQLANLEKNRVNSKKWNQANPEKCNSYSAKRRALKVKATPGWFEETAVQELYLLAKTLTKVTGIKHHVDHIVPLNSKIVQGFHCLANLQILEARTNMVKSNRFWPDMP